MKMKSPSGKQEIDAHASQVESLINAGYVPVDESAATPAATPNEPEETPGLEMSEE